jgi:hypothetical protein
MIEFEGTLTKALLERARQRYPGRTGLIAGLLLLITGIIGFLLQPAPLEPARHYLPILAALFGGLIVTFALGRRGEKVPDAAVSGSVSEQRITIRVGDHEEHVQWQDFSGAISGDDYVVLQRSQFFTLILGRELFRDDASWNELRAIVARNVPPVQPQTERRTLAMLLIWVAVFAVVFLVYFWLRRPA